MATILQMVASLDAGSMVKTVEAMQAQADKLGRTLDSYTAKVDDKAAQASILRMTLQAGKLQEKLHTGLSIDGTQKAAMELFALEGRAAALQKRLNLKLTVDADTSGLARFGGGFRRGFGGVLGLIPGLANLGSSVAGPAASGGGLLGLLGGGAGAGIGGGGTLGIAGGIAALVAPTVAALVDASVGQVLGFGGAGAGFLLAGKFPAHRVAAARGITGAGGPGGTAAALRVLTAPGAGPFAAGLDEITKMLRAVAQAIGPSMGMMFAAFGKNIAALTPQLARFFTATLPFFQQFLSIATVAARTILPALTQVLQQLVQSGALKIMTQGFVFLIQGIADFIKHIGGPAMKAGAEVFRALSLGIKGILIGLGATFGWLGGFALKEYAVLRKGWDDFRHWFAGEFDFWRHWWANAWDNITRTVTGMWNALWKDAVSGTIDGTKHLISLISGWARDFTGFFKRLPGEVIRAMEGFGTDLYNFGRMALSKMWNGMKNVFSSVWSWFGSLPGKLLNAIGIHSPPDWAIEAGKHIMGGLLHGITSRKNELLGAFKDITAMGTAGGGRVGPSAAAAMRYAQSLFPRYGWSMGLWPALRSLWMGESGWNYQARNPTSGAYGIPQALPASKMASAGSDWLTNAATQIRWGLSYIASVYGNPGAAYSMWLSRSPHWYGSGLAGGIFDRPTLIGVGERGPERVDITPAGSRGGGATNIYVTVQVGHGTHPVAAAKEIARLLNDGAKSGVKLRTSILGPG